MSSPASRAIRRLWLSAVIALALPAAAQTDDDAEPAEELIEESEAIEEGDPEPAETPIPIRVMAERGVIDRAVRSKVEDGGYRFCSDQRYRIPRSDRDLCVLAEAGAQRCPEFRAACERPDDGRAAAKSRRQERQKEAEDRPFKLPTAMSGLARAIFWLLIAIGIVALVIAIVKNALPSKKDEPAEAGDDEHDTPEKAPRLVRGPVETDAERLLAR